MADRSKVLSWTELRVGLVLIASLVVLAATTLYIGGGGASPFADKYEVRALMADVNGLKEGAPVRVGGLDVGNVTGVDFAPGGKGMIEVRMKLDRRVQPRVTTRSVVELGALGLLGEKAIDISASTEGLPIEDGGLLPAAGDDAFKSLVSDTSESVTHMKKILSRIDAGQGLVGKALRDEELYDRLTDVSARLQDFMGRLEGEKGPLGRLVNDREMSAQLAATARGLDHLVGRIERGEGPLGTLSKDEELVRQMKSTAAGFADVAGRMQRGEGTLGRLVHDEQLYTRLEALTVRLDAITLRLDHGEGSAGRLLKDPELYENMNGTFADLRALVGDVRRDPRKYLHVRVSLF
jgi:phospholipid/cholesterol/gamma-HCH transport system substrate-binding protein